MHKSGVFTYGGEPRMPGFIEVRFDLRNGTNSIFADPDSVAPAEVEASVNLKDPRIQVVKRDKKPGYWAAGPWEATIVGDDTSTWHRTKKDGVEDKARRLAIRDWHEQEAVQ
jgi:hypothetical protein